MHRQAERARRRTGRRGATTDEGSMHAMGRLALAAALGAVVTAPAQGQVVRYTELPRFTVTSTDLRNGARIADRHVYKGFGCDGGNLSPQLSWKGFPAGTKSFAVLVFDPDAPTLSGWWHWLVHDIPATVTSLPRGAGDPAKALLPAGSVQTRTDFGAPGYGGPCPPPKDRPHTYRFIVVALGVPKLEVPANATAALVSFTIRANALAAGEVMGRYTR